MNDKLQQALHHLHEANRNGQSLSDFLKAETAFDPDYDLVNALHQGVMALSMVSQELMKATALIVDALLQADDGE